MKVTLKMGDVILYKIDVTSFVVISDAFPSCGQHWVSVVYLEDGQLFAEPEKADLFEDAVYLSS